MSTLKLEDDFYCFGCGKNNPIGLKLDFKIGKDKTIFSEFTPQKIHQGYTNITHGGIMALVLDEIMGNLPWKLGKPSVAAELAIKLKRPSPVGKKLFLSAKIENELGHVIQISSAAKNEKGEIMAAGWGKYVVIEEGIKAND